MRLPAVSAILAIAGASSGQTLFESVSSESGTVPIAWQTLKDGKAAATFRNRGTSAARADFKLNLPPLQGPGGCKAGVVSLQVEPGVASPGELVTVRFVLTDRAKDCELASAPPPGEFILPASQAGNPVSRPFQIALPAPSATAPQKVVDKQSATVFSFFTYFACNLATFDIPVKDKSQTALRQDQNLGWVQALSVGTDELARDGVTPVRLDQTNPNQTAGGYRLRVRTAAPLRLPGKYSGKVQLNESDKETSVGLDVTVKDYPLIPILVLVIGVGAALLVKHYVNVRRTVIQFQSRLEVSERQFAAANKAVEAKLGGTLAQDLSLKDDFNKNVQAVKGSLTALNKNWISISQDDPNLQNASKTLPLLESAAANWRAAGERIAHLLQIREEVTAKELLSYQPPVAEIYGISRPVVGGRLNDLFHRGTVQLASLSALLDEANAMGSGCARFLELLTRLLAANEFLSAAKTEDPAMQAKIDSAKTQLSVAASAVWMARDTTDLQATDPLFQQLSPALAALACILPPASPRKVALVSSSQALSAAGALAQPAAVASIPLALPPPDRRLLQDDLRVAIFSVIVALITAAQVKYLGKPFGSMQDYIELFLYGIGTQAISDILNQYLGRFVAQRA